MGRIYTQTARRALHPVNQNHVLPSVIVCANDTRPSPAYTNIFGGAPGRHHWTGTRVPRMNLVRHAAFLAAFLLPHRHTSAVLGIVGINAMITVNAAIVKSYLWRPFPFNRSSTIPIGKATNRLTAGLNYG
ncbi:hypothetical protein SBA6_510010 [Candidatus Sulfopaludibacter sp. SbA6]|nr:hypothetical protein SBA6_510010 [Candidatus Sulfopaludibacter sp. SbA6]